MNVAATEKPITKRPGTTPPQLIVVAASNKRNGPEAAYFPGTDKKRVEKAAKCLGASTLEVSSKALETLASKLPRGKLLSNGKVTLEAVDERVFRQLAAYVPVAQRGAVRAYPPSTFVAYPKRSQNGEKTITENTYARAKAGRLQRSGKCPEHWGLIKVGSLVLASDGADDGWWTAHVREVRPDCTYLLEWETFPGYDTFVRRREQIGLLHPDYDGK